MKKLLILLSFCTSLFAYSQSPNDCVNAIPVCGGLNLGLEPNGQGEDEFGLAGNIRPSCYAFNNNTIWLTFNFETDGVFTFDIIPTNGTDDYDFAIYGPNVDCENLGAPIRCSSTNPEGANVSADTGLNMFEVDTEEGPGADGNGYLKYIEVTGGSTYYVIVDRAHGSEDFNLEYTGTSTLPDQPTAFGIDNITDCEQDLEVDGSISIDLDAFIPEIIQSQTNVEVSFYNSQNDVGSGTDALQSPYENINNPETIYYRVENKETGCFAINEFTIEVLSPFSVELPTGLAVCNNLENRVTLSTQEGYSYYEWSTGEEGANLNEIEIGESGIYWVVVTDSSGCKVKSETVVEGGDAAVISEVLIDDFRYYNKNSITILTEQEGDYEYSVDHGFYSEDNTFSFLSAGHHVALVRDKMGCGISAREFLILDYPRYFTPNEDGIKDTWRIRGIEDLPITTIHIYDRYGKILKLLDPREGGWDGNYRGIPMPSNDYWFTLVLEDGRTFKGHFTLKR